MNYIVYKHTTPSGKVYIGITGVSANHRWDNGNGYKTQAFGRAIKKYGWDNIQHEILFEGLTESEAKQKERELILAYDSVNPEKGYNKDYGGSGTGKMTESGKRKVSESHKGDKHYLYGKHIPEETRKKMSESRKGDKNGFYGKTFSDEVLKRKCKPVVQFDLNMNEIARFESVKAASIATGCHRGHISEVCKHNFQMKTVGGYIWRYVEEVSP